MIRDDDFGAFWEVEHVERTRHRAAQFRQAPPPANYSLPSPFRFRDARCIGFDIETHDPDLLTLGPGPRRDGVLVGVAVRVEGGPGDYFPIGHKNGPNLPREEVLSWVREELADFTGIITGTNLLYDMDYMAHDDVWAHHAKFRDVQWAAPLLDELAKTYDLDTLASRYLGKHKAKDELEALYGKDYISNMHLVHPGHARTYGLGDVDLPIELLPVLESLLVQDGISTGDGDAMLKLYHLECRLFPMLLHMRRIGVRIDIDRAGELNDTIKTQHGALIKEIKRDHGVNVSATVPTAEAVALLQKNGMVLPKTLKGNPSVRTPWLEAQNDPLCQKILEIRKLEKLRGTFVQGYLQDHNVNGRIHCQFHPLRSEHYGTVSGRFSSSTPNLQNIPKRDPILGPLIRSLFLPEEGELWWTKDYSQIEYRFLVHYAMQQRIPGADKAAAMYINDPNTDFHAYAAEITGVPRGKSKNINFGVAYGMGPPTMAYNMGVSLIEGKAILAEFHTEMPFLKGISNKSMNFAQKHGYIPTILRRKRRYPYFEKRGDYKKKDKEFYIEDIAREKWGNNIQRAHCQAALNGLLQGSAADEMKQALVNTWEAGCFTGTGVTCSLTVHDESNGSTPQTPIAIEALAEVHRLMENAIPLSIPVLVDGDVGANWSEAK